jgi:hypothetical protein
MAITKKAFSRGSPGKCKAQYIKAPAASMIDRIAKVVLAIVAIAALRRISIDQGSERASGAMKDAIHKEVALVTSTILSRPSRCWKS